MATMRLNARARLSCIFPAVFAWREASVECEARHAPDASDRLASFSREGGGSWALLQGNWCVHCCCGHSVFRDKHFNSKQPSGLNKLHLNISTSGWVFLRRWRVTVGWVYIVAVWQHMYHLLSDSHGIYIAWNFESFPWNVRMLPLVHLYMLERCRH